MVKQIDAIEQSATGGGSETTSKIWNRARDLDKPNLTRQQQHFGGGVYLIHFSQISAQREKQVI